MIDRVRNDSGSRTGLATSLAATFACAASCIFAIPALAEPDLVRLPKVELTAAAPVADSASAAANERTFAQTAVNRIVFQWDTEAQLPQTCIPAPNLNASGTEYLPAPPGQPNEQSSSTPASAEIFPLDLPTALQLAEGQNLQIRFARERILAAQAQYDRANVLWLPTMTVGPRWMRHDGQIQDTRGEVITVSRSSLFAGGGATIAVGTSEAYFAPLAARQMVVARQAGSQAVTNSTLLEVAYAYWEVVRNQANQTIVLEAYQNSEKLDKLAQAYLRSEKLKQADAERIRAATSGRAQESDVARQETQVASARLARLLRLDPFVALLPAEDRPIPIELVDVSLSSHELAATALSNRPEVAESRALVSAAVQRLRQARLGPLLPSLLLDYDAGGFGGGPNEFFGDFDGRSDADLGAVWTFQNLGLGDRALQRERASEVRQTRIEVLHQMDQIATDVAEALARVQARHAQIEQAQQEVAAAMRSYELNAKLFSEGGIELILPIEVLQSVNALATARQNYLTAIIEYNRAQFQLHWALGFPVDQAATVSGESARNSAVRRDSRLSP